MATSPELTGNTGSTYETQVAACYLTALLVGGEGLGLEGGKVETVAVQRKVHGDLLDDVVVEAVRNDGIVKKLQLQAKVELRLTAAETNADFREIVSASLQVMAQESFQPGVDRFGAATESIAMDSFRGARRLHERAIYSSDESAFREELESGTLGKPTLKVEAEVQSLMTEFFGRAPSKAEVWGFWRHALFLRIETLGEGATQRHSAVDRLRLALAPADEGRASDLFDVLEGIARRMNGAAGKLDRRTLIERLDGRFAFKGDGAAERLEAGTLNARAAAREDLDAFKRRETTAFGSVALLLQDLAKGEDAPLIDHAELVKRFSAGTPIIIEAQPGAGKSTTLFQIADVTLTTDVERTPVVLPLREYAGGSIIEEVHRRRAFASSGVEEVRRLADAGRLVLLLDAWNEVPTALRLAVSNGLEQFGRDYPHCPCVLTTRTGTPSPIKGESYGLALLSPEQQYAIITDKLGPAGGELLSRAQAQPLLADLISVPLYLVALSTLDPSSELPSTKERLLAAMVEKHEQVALRHGDFAAIFRGMHRQVLTSVATDLVNRGTTTISEADLRREITLASTQLHDQGQISRPLEPAEAIQALIDHYGFLKGELDGGPAYSLPHEQIQEWFASFAIDQRARAATPGDPTFQALLADFVDRQSWAEPLLFAAERLGRSNESDQRACARVICFTLGIDPFFAARLVSRAGDAVWQLVEEAVLAFADAWLAAEPQDRNDRDLVDFYARCGRPELAERLAAQLSNDQKPGATIGRSSGFAIFQVLGPDWTNYASRFTDQVRREVLYDVAYRGGQGGRRTAFLAAIEDPSHDVLHSVLNIMEYEGADDLNEWAHEIPEAAWPRLALTEPLQGLREGDYGERLIVEKLRIIEQRGDPAVRVRLLFELAEIGIGDDFEELAALVVEQPPDPNRLGGNDFSRVAALAPAALSRALSKRLLAGERLPFRTGRYIRAEDVTDQARLVAIATARNGPNGSAEVAANLLDQDSVANLVCTYLNMREQGRSAFPYEAYRGIEEALERAELQALFKAVRSVEIREDTIELLGEILARHRRFDRDEDAQRGDVPVGFEELIVDWSEHLLAQDTPSRAALSVVARLIGRYSLHTRLDTLVRVVTRELARFREEREDYRNRLATGAPRTGFSSTSHIEMHKQAFDALEGVGVRDALVTLLDDPDFGGKAAFALVRFANEGIEQKGPSVLNDLPADLVARRRAAILDEAGGPPSEVAAIVIEKIGHLLADGSAAAHQRASEFAIAATQMNFGSAGDIFERVLHTTADPEATLGLLKGIASRGILVSETLVAAGMQKATDALLDGKWHSDNDWWRVRTWFDVAGYAEDPSALIQCIERIPPEHRRSHELSRFVVPLGYSPAKTAVATLEGLAKLTPELKDNHEWMNSLLRQGTEEAATIAFEAIFEGQTQGASTYRHDQLAASIIRSMPSLKQRLIGRLRDPGDRKAGVIAARALSDALDPDTVIQLIEQSDGDLGSLGPLMAGIERMIVDREESPDESWHTLTPKEANAFRASLFDILIAGEPRARQARELLKRIDRIRRDYGRPLDENRHPNIQKQRPWPEYAEIGWAKGMSL